MARESKAGRRKRTEEIIRRLHVEHPDAHCALDHRNAYELTVATILSAQCTDERVNQVTPALFAKHPDAGSLARADQEGLELLINPTGFFRNKAKSLLGMARAVVERHGGEIPKTMEELNELPGVGRKTANVVLGNAFGIDEGIVVDTHVRRLSQRLGLSREEDPEKIERDLMDLVPREEWTDFSHLLIFHGRRVCHARKPKHDECAICELCPTCDRSER